MRKIAGPACRGGEEGFTLLETLVALVVLSVLGIGAWTAVSVAWRSVERVHAGSRAGAEVLRLDDRLRACAGRVRPPWWGGEPVLEVVGDTWRVSCLDGDPGTVLTLSWRDGVLSIDDGGTRTRHRGFADVELASARDGAGVPFGVELSCAADPLGRFTIIASFGGRTVQQGAPR
jgi:prepilin-type N-terminal cleavage/methylation domain-containing protein